MRAEPFGVVEVGITIEGRGEEEGSRGEMGRIAGKLEVEDETEDVGIENADVVKFVGIFSELEPKVALIDDSEGKLLDKEVALRRRFFGRVASSAVENPSSYPGAG